MNTQQMVASPCRNICQLDAQEICIGCGRSLAEVAEWSRASVERQQAICQQAQARLATFPQAQNEAQP